VFDVGRFYRPREVWRLSNAPRDAVYEALRSGQLRAIRRGNRWLIPGGAVVEWLEGVRP
jgi:excisionase family DNA binding protein